MAESLFILELEFLHIRDGCSLIIVFFVLMLVGICCLHVVYYTKVMLPSNKKDSVPANQKSCLAYEFSCRCEARYVRRTTQKLADKIKQHAPTSIGATASQHKICWKF